MRCPTVNELPPPPAGKRGWPWNEETTEAPHGIPDDQPWPRLSITTPNYNCGQFLEETIRSILLQGYPDLEYTIIDAGSTDSSLEIIKKYEKWLTYWVSEPDRGQSHAINKGFRRATGDVVQWINSDDFLTPGALFEVSRLAIRNPGAMVGGGCEWFGEGLRRQVVSNQGLSRERLIAFWRREATYQQPSLFVPRVAIQTGGLLDESLRYCFDLDWFIRVVKDFRVVYTNKILSRFRVHPDAKTSSEWSGMLAERQLVSERYWNEIDGQRAQRESLRYCRREARLRAWNVTVYQLLKSEGRKSQKVWRLLLEVRNSPWLLARRETLGAILRIVAPGLLAAR